MTVAAAPTPPPRRWTLSLASQVILLSLGALLVASALSLALFSVERGRATDAAYRLGAIGGAASIKRVLERAAPGLRPAIAAAATGRRIRYSVDPAPRLRLGDPGVEPLARRGRPWVARAARHRGLGGALIRIGPPLARDQVRRPSAPGRPPLRRLEIAAPLAGGGWLNIEALAPPPRIRWVGPSLFGVLGGALLLAGTLIWGLRRTTRPLGALADAADRLGRGEAVAPLPETGPAEVRRASAAFNGMRDRLTRFVADRTHMLAAVSHDLRSPITALRLRAELVDDAETRAALLATLDEMAAMTESALAFAREDAVAEETRAVDLGALLESVVEDARDLGQRVALAPPPRTPYRCRPTALRRALRNLIENADRYAGGAEAALILGPEGPRFVVEDRGPGMTDAERARAFEPFVRLERSRSLETGGVGLGLSIVRSVARAHGGEARLSARPGGGLTAMLALPPQAI